MDQETQELLKNLTNKEHIKLVARGNKAIQYALKIAKKLGKKRLLIQDQGGWFTYRDFGLKLKFDIIELKTDYGIVDINTLKENIDKNSALLINSLTGYFAEQPIDKIYNICRANKCLLINDVSGSIGSENAKFGDILVCSFGNDKPINLGKGGFIAIREKEWSSLTSLTEVEPRGLKQKLINLSSRLFSLKKLSKKIKKDLKDYDIIHKESDGINVIVRFNNKEEKQNITDYCEKNKYEYTICPRYIRVNCDAISIEVKRILQNKIL